MKERIRLIRKAVGLNQPDFGKAVGVSLSAVQKWESGENDVSDAVILLICQKFGINETWLRTGEGDMKAELSRAEELGALTARLLADRPDSFRSALMTALLRLDPAGPEWAVFEQIYNSVADAMNAGDKKSADQ